MLATVPVNSVDAHDEGLYVGVRGTAELAAGLSAERGAVTQREMVQRADGAAVSHHWESRGDACTAAERGGRKQEQAFRLWPRPLFVFFRLRMYLCLMKRPRLLIIAFKCGHLGAGVLKCRRNSPLLWCVACAHISQ